MSYPYILAILDAELDRLYQARQLLASSPEPIIKLRKPKTQSAEPSAETAQGASIALPLEAVIAMAETLEPELLEKRLGTMVADDEQPGRRRRSTTRMARKTAAAPRERISRQVSKAGVQTPSALSGTVPTGPVYVSAADMRKTQGQKEAESATIAEAGTGEMPTAAMLTQRWLTSQGA